MKGITLLTPAKINLSIDVLGRLPNGYHSVEMVMQSINLCDIVSIEKRHSGISIHCEKEFVPNDRRNIAYKAAEAFFAHYPKMGGVHISIKKHIPVSAGLGGGSTDAAGVLKGLNQLYGNLLTQTQLLKIAKTIGADVAFCLNGGTQLARGIGDELARLPDFENIDIVLVKPSFPISTAYVYRNLNLSRVKERPDTSALINAITEMDLAGVAENMVNVLETVSVYKYPELKTIMNRFKEYGALQARMSGSGPTIFGIFDDCEKAAYAKEQFLKDYRQVYYVKTIGRGD
ncbi:MAG: 4-(cytidine 5'-diphospho)-2-C-methyl-D-erythritol kinase [Clostridiaceae bacterium]|nr:4-(cytidine 5'-diphospho)-2-C-methyl-D-erythritol kinase [Clostridiaceae bacterium]